MTLKPAHQDTFIAVGLMLAIVVTGFVVTRGEQGVPGHPEQKLSADYINDMLLEDVARRVREQQTKSTHPGGPMDPYKDFGTPIEFVTFFVNGQERTLTHVVERWIHYPVSGGMVVVLKDQDGAFLAVTGWDSMVQAPGHSVF